MPALAPSDRHRELADFLRGRRARLDPSRIGVVGSARRRTPGLRREELAQLAGLSVDWYTRLEQGRDVNPSRETLESIARALGLDEDERGHLLFLGRPERRLRATGRREVADIGLARALETMSVPAVVLGPRLDILAWNAPMEKLLVPFGDVAPEQRNILWLTFHHPSFRARYTNLPLVEMLTVACFRFSAASFVGDADFDALIGALLESSESFRTHWARHDVRAKTSGSKSFATEAGELTLDWFALAPARDSGQQLVYYVPRARADEGERARFTELLSGDAPTRPR